MELRFGTAGIGRLAEQNKSLIIKPAVVAAFGFQDHLLQPPALIRFRVFFLLFAARTVRVFFPLFAARTVSGPDPAGPGLWLGLCIILIYGSGKRLQDLRQGFQDPAACLDQLTGKQHECESIRQGRPVQMYRDQGLSAFDRVANLILDPVGFHGMGGHQNDKNIGITDGPGDPLGIVIPARDRFRRHPALNGFLIQFISQQGSHIIVPGIITDKCLHIILPCRLFYGNIFP